MADTYTTNLNLKKPGYDSYADIKDLNDNFDKIDEAIANAGSVKSVNGQTGDVVIDDVSKLNGNSAEYYATAESVNQLSEKVAEATDSTPVSDASINGVSFQLFRCGKLAMVSLVSGQTSSQVAVSGVFGTLPDGFKPVLRVDFKDVYAEKRLWFDPDGAITAAGSDIAAGTILRGTITYVCA